MMASTMIMYRYDESLPGTRYTTRTTVEPPKYTRTSARAFPALSVDTNRVETSARRRYNGNVKHFTVDKSVALDYFLDILTSKEVLYA